MMLASSACSVLVSTSGLTGSSADAGAPTDAAIEQTTAEGGGEAGTDGGVDADAAGPFCAQHKAAFCADFDAVDVATGWTGTLMAGGTFVRDGDAVSAPFALRTSTPPTMTGASAARLWWDSAVPSAVHLELDVRFPSSPAGYYEALKIEFPTSFESDTPTSLSGAVEIISQGGSPLSARSEGWNESGVRYATPYPGTVTPDASKWVHVVVDATLGKSGSLRITLDGVTTVDVQGVRTLPATATAMRIVVGPFVDSNPLSTVGSYDNVLVDVTP